jgi:iron complex outermembrane receptor protein
MRKQSASFRACLMGGAAAAVLTIYGGPAVAQERAAFDIPSQPLADALKQFGYQSGHDVLASPSLAEAKLSPGVAGEQDIEVALNQVLEGSGLSWRRNGDTFLIVKVTADPQSGSAAGDGADGTVEALIVTAQKREEDIQDVPIAISAFTQEQLTDRQVAGGPDLMTQVPNFTFTKTNFSSYSIQIRGIGTQAISATVDPAVAVAFNNTPFIRNRFFEQEFYDLQRVEVLRGPQGTLYGRNATAGVVNIISAKPSFQYDARLSGDIANYNSTRLEGMINIPLVEDQVALRLAGAWTKRDGYAVNEITGNPIDGRDLWSTRLSLRIEPTDHIRADLIWEHFEEDDDRLRSGKQLCKKDVRTHLNGISLGVPSDGPFGQPVGSPVQTFNQGCVAASFYADESFQTPTGHALPYYLPLGAGLGLPIQPDLDPYLSTVQSRDLRVIESTVDPEYRAKTDVAEMQISFDVTDSLTLTSETAYSTDELFSMQDYNRFNTAPGAFNQATYDEIVAIGNVRPGILNDGVFCDPQIGCANRLVAVDVSTARSTTFSQEFRLASNYDGPFNFSLGANFLRYDTEDKYYVFINTLSFAAAASQNTSEFTPYAPSMSDNRECFGGKDNIFSGLLVGDPNEVQEVRSCIYMDPNPIGSLNDLGHNYFLSKNPYRLISYAGFGEAYYSISESLKITGGLRWTVDKKRAPRIPSWLLASQTVGYPVAEIVDLEWREPTGRLTVDWKPDVAFTDETLLYGSYAHGYKAGGANPPPTVLVTVNGIGTPQPDSPTHPKTFDAEFVDAFEIGAKNTMLDGRLTANASAFYYDYKGYQISQIVDRSAVNLNFDAEVWGLEIEADWRPLENLRLGFKGGYENTRMADGSRAIDLMDRTAGNPDWVVARPFPTIPSNCILPVSMLTFGGRINLRNDLVVSLPDDGPCVRAYIEGVDPLTELPYVPNPTIFKASSFTVENPPQYAGYPGFNPSSAPNNGQGFFKDLSGNELPNAPHYTATLTADYTLPLPNEWLATLHTDFYYQSEAWTRVFNTEGYDKLKAYTNVNVAAIFTNEDAGWKVMAYVKNVFDRDSITGAFLNSDDTGLTTNVFLTEPRLYGLRVTKDWTGLPWSIGAARPDGASYPFTLELAGGPSRLESDSGMYAPAWIDTFRASADFPLHPQDHELDWGDDREFKATYAFGGHGGWRLSAGLRYGRANGSAHAEVSENTLGFCVFSADKYAFCQDTGPLAWATTDATDRESYALADFMVGKDVGIGSWGGGQSVVGFGVRYAEFSSESDVLIHSDPDRYLPPEDAIKYHRHWHNYHVDVNADREFKGWGPQLSWEASGRLFGRDGAGQVDLDWGLSSGVLFGKQKVRIRDETTGVYTNGAQLDEAKYIDVTEPIYELATPSRSKSVTVPNVGASLGLSYAIDRLKVGAGYRWERYFDVIDGGFDEPREYDRTIDGPYFKLSVGFGG